MMSLQQKMKMNPQKAQMTENMGNKVQTNKNYFFF